MLEGWTPDCPLAASWLSNALGVSHSFGRHLGDDGDYDGDDGGDDGGRDDGNGGGELVIAMRDHDALEGPGSHIGNLCRFSLNDFHLCRKGTQVDM